MNRNRSFRVTVTGANGFVGRNVISYFTKKGIQVTSIMRKDKSATKTSTKLISQDLSERYLVSKLRGCSVLLHFIGKGRQTVDDDYEKVNVGLTKKAVNLCKRAGIKKIIYISGLGVDKNTNFGYFISKYKAEQEIIRSGLDYTIFRASYIIGKNDPLARILLKQIKKNKIIIPGSGNYRLQPIYVEDVGKVLLQAASDKNFSNKIIDLVGPQTITYKCFIKDFLLGKRIKIEKMDLEKAYRKALHEKNSDFGIDDLNILVGDFVGNHEKLKKMTGIKFRTYREVLKTSCTS